jgi:hypothetical protein
VILERLLLVLPLLVVTALTLWTVRSKSPLEPSILLIVATAIIGTYYPVGAGLVKPLTWRHGAHLPEDVLIATQMQYLAFAIGACFVVAGVRIRRASARRPSMQVASQRVDRAATEFRDLVIAGGLVAGGALLYSLYVRKVGLGPLLDRHNFAEKYRVSSGLGGFYLGLNLVIVGCLWAEASQLTRASKNAFRAVAALVCLWAIAFIAVRHYAVALFLGYVYLVCRNGRFTLARVKPGIAVALLVGYLGVEAFALLRASWRGNIADALVTVQREHKGIEQTLGQIVGGSELSHPFLTTMELTRFEVPGALAGSSYADALLGILPLWLYPDRPPTPAQEFARRHYPSFEARGGGTAFSIVGEASWNFGVLLGPLSVGAALAWLLGRMERAAHGMGAGYAARFQPYIVHMVVLLHRGSAVSVAKHLFSIALPVALLACAAHLVWNALQRRASIRASHGAHLRGMHTHRSCATLGPIGGGT